MRGSQVVNRDKTASECRFMIGKFLADWKRAPEDKILNAILGDEIRKMIRFARLIHAIDDKTDNALWHYSFKLQRKIKCAE